MHFTERHGALSRLRVTRLSILRPAVRIGVVRQFPGKDSLAAAVWASMYSMTACAARYYACGMEKPHKEECYAPFMNNVMKISLHKGQRSCRK